MQNNKSTAQSTSFFDSIKKSIRNFIHPTTIGARQQRNEHIKDVALFAVSTVALIALQKQIAKLISLEVSETSRLQI